MVRIVKKLSLSFFFIHIFEESIAEDACYLLCSDGVNDLMSDREIYNLLMPSPVENGNILLQALQTKGLKDNTSFIILEIQWQEYHVGDAASGRLIETAAVSAGWSEKQETVHARDY